MNKNTDNSVMDKLTFYITEGTPCIDNYISSLYDDIEDNDIFLTAFELLQDISKEVEVPGDNVEDIYNIMQMIKDKFLSSQENK